MIGSDYLLIVAIVVFCLLLIGIGLTVYEFHYHILHEDDNPDPNKQDE